MTDIDTDKIYDDFVKSAESMKAGIIQLADAVQNFAKVVRDIRSDISDGLQNSYEIMRKALHDPEIRAADQREAAEVPEVRADGRAGGHEPGIL